VTLAALRHALELEGGTVAETLAPAPGVPSAPGGSGAPANDPANGGAPAADGGPPRLAASGPRAAGRPEEYELLLEMILEGSLLHYGSPRLVRGADPDLALLLGDQLYALGLSRLAELGDLDAVSELADLISLLAQAQAAGDARLAEEIWQAGAVAIGWGSSPDHEAGKALARAGDPCAVDALARARAAVMTHTADEGK
jgi:hypothetical protein